MFSVFFRVNKAKNSSALSALHFFLHKPHQRWGIGEYSVLVNYRIAKSLTLYAVVWGSVSLWLPRKVCSCAKRDKRSKKKIDASWGSFSSSQKPVPETGISSMQWDFILRSNLVWDKGQGRRNRKRRKSIQKMCCQAVHCCRQMN